MLRQPFKGSYPITLYFGDTYENLYTASNPHKGIDYACPLNTPILAADDGTVMKVGYEKNGYGNYIFIQHANGVASIYAHLNMILVHAGEIVKKGQEIADSGSTGNSTGPHLHFETRKDISKQSTAFDPMSIMQSVYDIFEEKPKEVSKVIKPGICEIVCDLANARNEKFDILATLPYGTKVDISDEVIYYNGLPYRKGKIEVLVAERDSYGTSILRNI